MVTIGSGWVDAPSDLLLEHTRNYTYCKGNLSSVAKRRRIRRMIRGPESNQQPEGSLATTFKGALLVLQAAYLHYHAMPWDQYWQSVMNVI